MSDTTEVTTTDDTSKATRKPRKDVPFSSCHVRFASSKGIDVTRAAKLNRSYVRSNFDALVKQWPALRASQKKNRDNNRYPEMIPAHVADQIVKRALTSK
jgi:hypothetical protein